MKHDRYFKFLVAIILLGLVSAFSQAAPETPAAHSAVAARPPQP